jgi:SAM-dependent methyltransferase/DNA-binding HxlR family transcriptional regulator
MHNEQQIPPPARMMQMITGFWTSCCIYAAAKLDVAGALAARPQTAAQLAAATQTHAPSLYRLLRALASVGIFKRNERDEFELTPLGNTLRADVPGSMRAMAIAQLGDHFRAWGDLVHSVKTGEIAFDHVEGMPVWKYYEAHPEDGLNFMKAMAGLTQAVIMNIVPAYDFSRFGTIIDVGGGNGALLSAVLKAAPGAKGIVFDEDYVVKETAKRLEADGLSPRCAVVGGSFFDFVPEHGDAHLLKMILHDWDDEQCVRILKNCARALKAGGKVLVMDSVIPAGDEPHPGKFMDINMLAMTGGRERTQAEFAVLFEKAGLRLGKVVHTHSPLFSIVEAVKD